MKIYTYYVDNPNRASHPTYCGTAGEYLDLVKAYGDMVKLVEVKEVGSIYKYYQLWAHRLNKAELKQLINELINQLEFADDPE